MLASPKNSVGPLTVLIRPHVAPDEDLVLLFSGGYESTRGLHIARARGLYPLLLSVDLPHNDIEDFNNAIRIGMQLQEDEEATFLMWRLELPYWNGQGRDQLLLSLAHACALDRGISKVYTGAYHEG